MQGDSVCKGPGAAEFGVLMRTVWEVGQAGPQCVGLGVGFK